VQSPRTAINSWPNVLAVSQRIGALRELPRGPRRGRLFRVLVVCTANQCRSPAIERLLGRVLVGGPPARFDVASAGTQADPGLPVHPLTASALGRRGVGVEGHAAQRLSRDQVDGADLVLTATREHRAAVVALQPMAAGRCFTLGEFARLAPAVVDLGVLNPPELVAGAAVLRPRLAPSEPAADDLPDPVHGGEDAHEAMVAAVQRHVGVVSGALLTAAEPVDVTLTKGRRAASGW